MSQTNFTYRIANSADVPALCALGLLSYGQYREEIGTDNWKKMEASLSDLDKMSALLQGANCFVCFDGNKMIGMVFLIESGHPWDIFEADWSYIRLLGVDPSYQGKGIARQLMQMCLNLAKAKGENLVALHTGEYMAAGRHLYESMGFKILRELPKRFDQRYWLYTLEF